MSTTTTIETPPAEAKTETLPANKSLVPIQEELIKSGLITKAEAEGHNDLKSDTPATQTPSTPSNPDRVVVQMRGSNDPGRKATPRRTQGTQAPLRGSVKPPVKNETPLDPLDVRDAEGFTPRMRQWMADPGFPMLLDILQQQRPKGSKSELEMIAKYIYTIPGITEDRFGNCIVDIGENSHGVLWSCHTDTVHSKGEEGRQGINITTDGYLQLRYDARFSSCLGADDGTGVWIMLQMIQANVPGRYVFHFGEEAGCIGSSAIRKNRREDVLTGMRYAIAFDRAGTSDVITHQRGRRCCSDAFALSIARQLPGDYKPTQGVYTDTAEYLDVIPECTNLSVGYAGQHTSREVQYLPHLYALRDAMLTIDPSQFVCERDPAVQEARQGVSTFRGRSYASTQEYYDSVYGPGGYYDQTYGQISQGGQGGTSSGYEGSEEGSEDEIERVFGKNTYTEHGAGLSKKRGSRRNVAGGHGGPSQRSSEDTGDRVEQDEEGLERHLDEDFTSDRPPTPRDLRELTDRYRVEVASVLEEMGFTVHDFWPEILSSLGLRKQ